MFDAIVKFLVSFYETEAARRTLVRLAFNDRPAILAKIEYKGTGQEFTTHLVTVLQQHGEVEPGRQALWHLLLTFKEDVGENVKLNIDTFEPYANTSQPRLRATLDTNQPLIFISYSRANRDFAEGLRQDLIDNNFRVWHDVHNIPPGSDWWAAIQEAIDHCDTMVLCLSMPALRSPIFSDEWIYARRQGKRILPVIADEVFHHPDVVSGLFSLPNWIKRYQSMDLRETAVGRDTAWAKLLHMLRTPYIPQPVPFPTKSTELPPNYIIRSDDFEPLVNALVNNKQEAVAIVAALKGAGGYGKTTLAKALCRDLRVSGAFDDGILWITLGESLLDTGNLENELISRLKDAILILTDKPSAVTTLNASQDAFAKAIGDKYVLTVVDDVWAESHAQPFIVRGKHNATLLTTRDADTMPRGTEPFRVDQMKQDDAYRLLTAGIPPVLPIDTAEIEALVKRLGRWALLLSLVNHWLVERVTVYREPLVQALLYANELLNDEGLEAFNPANSQERQKAATTTLNASVKRLPAELQARYQRLAIFPDDVPIPLATLSTLWQISPAQTKRTVERLWKASLLQDYDTQTIKLHDVVRAYLRETHRGSLEVWNRDFLGNYPVQGWHELASDEPYLWRWLAYHFREADQLSVLRDALLDSRYLQRKLIVTNPLALITDCNELKDDATIGLVRSVLSQAIHVLERDQKALLHQLIGRLMAHSRTNVKIQTFIKEMDYPVGCFYQVNPDSEYATHVSAGGPLLRTFPGRQAIELRDNRLLSWADDSTLRLWAADGTPLAVLNGHTRPIKGALQLADGHLLSWADDNILRLWTADGTFLASMKGHTDSVRGVLQLFVGHLLSWADDNTLCIWAIDGTRLSTLKGHTHSVRGVIELRNGLLLSWANYDTPRLWTADGTPLDIPDSPTSYVRGFIQLADGRLLFWAYDTLHFWSADGMPLAILDSPTRYVRGFIQLADSRLLSWADDGTLSLWSVNGTLLATLKGHTHSVRGVIELRDGHLLSWADDTTLNLWATDGTPLAILDGHTDSVRGALELRDGRLLSWADDGTLRLWTIDSSGYLSPKAHTNCVGDIFELRDGHILSWADDTTLNLWATDGTLLTTLKGHTDSVRGALELRDGRLLSWADDTTLNLWATDGTLLTTLKGHTDSVRGAFELRDGRLLSWADDTTLNLWATDGTPLAILDGHTHPVKGALELRDGRLLSWADNGILRLWTGDAMRLASLKGHTGSVRGALELRDGRLLSWDDSNLRIWTGDGIELAILKDRTGSVRGALELRDGRLLSWADDGALRLWTGDGARLTTLDGHIISVREAYQLADDRLLSWADDGILRLWATDGTPLAILDGHTGFVRGVFQLANDRLLSWADDTTLRLWQAETGHSLAVFYGDAGIRCCVVSKNGTIIVGDEKGRVIFLRYKL